MGASKTPGIDLEKQMVRKIQNSQIKKTNYFLFFFVFEGLWSQGGLYYEYPRPTPSFSGGREASELPSQATRKGSNQLSFNDCPRKPRIAITILCRHLTTAGY